MLQRAFSRSARKALLFYSILFCPVLRPAIPYFFFASAHLPSLYSLNSAICASHLQQEKRLGCTPFHFELCFRRASLYHCRPLVLKAIVVGVSVPDLARCPAHRCKVHFLCLFWFMSNLSMIESPFRCLSLHHSVNTVCSPFLNLAVSATVLALHHRSFSCHVSVGCRAAASPQQTRPYSNASILFRNGSNGQVQDSLPCRVCLFFPNNTLCCTIGAELLVSAMHMSTTANLSVHCSISVPARNQRISCFCVELQFVMECPMSSPISLKLVARSSSVFSSASFDAAKISRSSAQATTGKYQ